MLNIRSTITLANGVEIPRLGLGAYQTKPGPETEQAVLWALKAGYRHIDTAAVYKNEESVGAAIRKSGLDRKEVFVTTKLWTSAFGEPEAALKASLARLRMDHVDLYLLHWPVEGLRMEAWMALEKLHARGLARAIGVSNYTVRHLSEILGQARMLPLVNQVELSPFLPQATLRSYCEGQGIVVEAYSPLTRGKRLDDPALNLVAKTYRKTPAQILIRWALQHDLVVLPKSSRRERIEENADVFDFQISGEDMEALDSLDENLHTCWDPAEIP